MSMLIIATSCGSSTGSTDGASSATSDSSVEDQAVDFNDADVMFAQMMIPHHEQAIELSDMALDPQIGASDVVRDLANRIKAAQDPEIDQMTSLLESWGESTAMDSSMDHGSMMSGMLSVDELDALAQLRGADFDRAWLEAMVAHHEGAIEMADDVLRDGTNEQIRALAEAITSAQKAEIDEMRGLLG